MVLQKINNQCKKCGSKNTYTSSTHTVCRKCGHKMQKMFMLPLKNSTPDRKVMAKKHKTSKVKKW